MIRTFISRIAATTDISECCLSDVINAVLRASSTALFIANAATANRSSQSFYNGQMSRLSVNFFASIFRSPYARLPGDTCRLGVFN